MSRESWCRTRMKIALLILLFGPISWLFGQETGPPASLPSKVASTDVLTTHLPPVGRADPAPQAFKNKTCVDSRRQERLEEIRPLEIGNLMDTGEGSSISILELSMRIPRKARKDYQEAIKALRDSRPADAQRLLIEALKLEPRYFQASTLLAVLFFNSWNYSAARMFAERARSVNPHYLRPLEVLGAVDVVDGKYSEAVTRLVEVVRLSPRWESAHYYLGIALLHSGQCEEGARHLEIAANASSSSPNVSATLSPFRGAS